MGRFTEVSPELINGKKILVTGATGSFGKAFVKYVCDNFKPQKLIIFSRDELKQYEMGLTFSPTKYPFLKYMLGDVRDKARLNQAFAGLDYVIHAAALKQVPAAEFNPSEYIKTNVDGSMNIIDAAIEQKVKKVVALSTDKAVNPINLYGATKLCLEKLFVSANRYALEADTRYSVVRYGNVVGSRGSVVPFFKKMKSTGVIPITDERMTRYFLTIPDAVNLVMLALQSMTGGEIFIPKIPSIKIWDLADIIAPGCKKNIIGIRPGEKIHETLVSDEESRHTYEREKTFVIEPEDASWRKSYSPVGTPVGGSFSYTSGNNKEWLNESEMLRMIEQLEGESH